MTIASALTPLVAAPLLLAFLNRLGAPRAHARSHAGWQGDFLIALAIWGALVVVISEALSLFTALDRFWLAAAWSLVTAAFTIYGIQSRKLHKGWQRLRSAFGAFSSGDWLLFAVCGLYLLLLFIVAIVTPSNNVDAMQYHLPRALHWAQDQSLRHYPVARIAQDIRPYWAEAVILHLRSLWGDDSPANLVQWFSLIACMVGATGISRLLDPSPRRRWLSAVFALTIPMAVLQASTAQNDLVAAMWVVALAYFVILSQLRALSRVELIALACSLGVGMLTKGTFFPFAGPLVAWYFLGKLRRKEYRQLVGEGLVIFLIVVALNSGLWIRNFRSYGGIFGNEIPVDILPGSQPEATIGDLQTQPWVWNGHQVLSSGFSRFPTTQPVPRRTEAPAGPALVDILAGWGTNVLQLVAMNFVSPFHRLNEFYYSLLLKVAGPFTPVFVGSLRSIVWNQENLAGSPLHLLAIFVASAYWWFRGLRHRERTLAEYALAALAGFSLLAFIGHATFIYSIRYQLPYLVLGAPLVGIGLARFKPRWVQKAALPLLLLYAIPYLLFSNMRPVIGLPPWPTRTGSIFTTEKDVLLFALNPGNRDEYERVAELIQSSSCQQVGLWLNHDDLEYAFWWLLDAPQSGIQLRFIRTGPQLEQYLDPNFQPCAVICTICQGIDSVNYVPLKVDYGAVQLYLQPEE